MAQYIFDGSMTGLLCCVYRAFQFKEFDVRVVTPNHIQQTLFDESIDVQSNEEQAQRVWRGLKQKVSSSGIRNFYYTFLSEQLDAFQS